MPRPRSQSLGGSGSGPAVKPAGLTTAIFYGHGRYRESDGYAVVPGGCNLFFCAKHVEEIAVTRMTHIWGMISEAIEDGVDWLTGGPFAKMKSSDYCHVRQVFADGASVPNYRLFPPDGLPSLNSTNIVSTTQDFKSPMRVNVITTDQEDGVTLKSLLRAHGGYGSRLVWICCRAIDGSKESLLDLYDFRGPTEPFEDDNTGQTVTPYYRKPDYYRGVANQFRAR